MDVFTNGTVQSYIRTPGGALPLAMKLQVIVVVVTLLIASFLPSEERFRRDRVAAAT